MQEEKLLPVALMVGVLVISIYLGVPPELHHGGLCIIKAKQFCRI